jgi:hypothetical protein
LRVPASFLTKDFPRLFDKPPAWNTDIDVFQIAPFYAEHATDEDLLRLASFLSRRHIVLGAAVQPTQIDGECAWGKGEHGAAQICVSFGG